VKIILPAFQLLVSIVVGLFGAGFLLPIVKLWVFTLLLSGGVGIPILYGIESVRRFGRVQGCEITFSTPICAEYNVLLGASLIAAITFAILYFTMRD
jgi:hypothetical protein